MFFFCIIDCKHIFVLCAATQYTIQRIYSILFNAKTKHKRLIFTHITYAVFKNVTTIWYIFCHWWHFLGFFSSFIFTSSDSYSRLTRKLSIYFEQLLAVSFFLSYILQQSLSFFLLVCFFCFAMFAWCGRIRIDLI